MRTVNKVILIGNVTKDPYVKTTQNGKKIALFTVATNRQFKSGTGAIMSEAEYTNCITWGNLADRSEQFLRKGKLVYIEGRLKTRNIDREDGTRLFKTEVVVSNLIFLNKKEEFEGAVDGALDDVVDEGLDSAEIVLDDNKF
jgi:single-strand DNA-binding protein